MRESEHEVEVKVRGGREARVRGTGVRSRGETEIADIVGTVGWGNTGVDDDRFTRRGEETDTCEVRGVKDVGTDFGDNKVSLIFRAGAVDRDVREGCNKFRGGEKVAMLGDIGG